MSFVNKDNFYILLSNLCAFYFFFLIIALARTFSMILHRSVESRRICLVRNLRVKAPSLSPLSMIFFFFKMLLIRWRNTFLFLVYWELLSWMVMAFFKYIFTTIEVIRWFLLFLLLIWWITLFDFQMLNQLCGGELDLLKDLISLGNFGSKFHEGYFSVILFSCNSL